MPAVSDKQKRFMDAAAHNPKFAKQAGVPVGVAQDFSEASKGQKFGTGTRPDRQEINKQKTDHGSMNLFKKGGVMKSDMKEDTKIDKKQDVAMIKKAFKEHDAQEHKGGKGTKITLRKGGETMLQDPRVAAMMAKRKMIPGSAPANTPAPPAMKKGGKVKKMASGGKVEKTGETMGPRTMSKDVEKGSNKLDKFGESAVQKRGHTKGLEPKMAKFAKGGSVSSRTDGIAQRGKTKTKYC
jgi:hypothetical protein